MQNDLLIMGILNVTPDSFSDGGLYLDTDSAFRQAEKMVTEGADIIDVGGESTRPGARPISFREEIDRVIPVLEGLSRRFDVTLSVDTRHFEVAKEAVAHGASIINDVSGGADIRMADLLVKTDIKLILMHMQGSPQTMQLQPSYPRGVLLHVRDFLASRVRLFSECGIPKENLWVDPGIGFGKTLEHNLTLLKGLSQFCEIGGRVVIGTSRKSFLSKVLSQENLSFEDREAGTIATNLWARTQGASVFRVHNVGQMKRALTTWEAVQNASES